MKRCLCPAYRPLNAGRKEIAEAGRFITKCEIVGGIVRVKVCCSRDSRVLKVEDGWRRGREDLGARVIMLVPVVCI